MGRYQSRETAAAHILGTLPGDQPPGRPPRRIRRLAPSGTRPEKAQEAKGVCTWALSKPQGDGAQRMRPADERMFSNVNPPSPLLRSSLCTCVGPTCLRLSVSVLGRSDSGRVFRCVRGRKRLSCQSLPPLGIVPLLLLVCPATGPRALRQPACRKARQPFPLPTHTGAQRRTMPWSPRLAAAVMMLDHRPRPILWGRKRTGTFLQPSIRHHLRRTDQRQRHLAARSTLLIFQPLVLLATRVRMLQPRVLSHTRSLQTALSCDRPRNSDRIDRCLLSGRHRPPRAPVESGRCQWTRTGAADPQCNRMARERSRASGRQSPGPWSVMSSGKASA